MRKFTFVTGFIFLLSLCGAGLVRAGNDPTALFVQGNEAYRQSKYGEAVQKYEEAVSSGRVSGALYYNLANSYYKKKKLGKAVLNYERARRYIPRDHDLQANFHFVASQVPSPSENQPSLWQNAMEKHLAFYTINETAWILLLLGVAMATVHLISLYFAWAPGRQRAGLIVLGGLFILYFAGLMIQLDRRDHQAVAVMPTVARFEPRPEATAHFDLHEGTRVRFLKSSDGWWKIERSDGKQGWVEKESVEKI